MNVKRRHGKVADVRSVRLYYEQWAWLEAEAARRNAVEGKDPTSPFCRRAWTPGDVIRALIDDAREAAADDAREAAAERTTSTCTPGRAWILACNACGGCHDVGACPGIEGVDLLRLSREIAEEFPGWIVYRRFVDDTTTGERSCCLLAVINGGPRLSAESVAELREKIRATGVTGRGNRRRARS